jgi:potassium-transporting ATPase potassium-binding subunit
MVWQDLAELALFIGILALTTRPLGLYLSKVFARERTFLDPVVGPVERLIYQVSGVSPAEDQTWRAYVFDLLMFSLVTMAMTYLVLELQPYLPLNPQNFPAMPWHLALNTAVSFTTNTNWQAYGGESTLGTCSRWLAWPLTTSSRQRSASLPA